MLRKLMKHEFRATLRVMLPLYLLLVVTALGARVSISGLLGTESALVDILASLLVVAFAIAMAAVCLVSVFLMVQRFYQNLLRDEGYVMMTLPVSVHQQVWSKLLVGVLWCAATVALVCLSLFILVFDLEMLEGFAHFARDVWAFLKTEYGFNGVLVALEVAVVCVLAMCSAYLEFYCALAIGHSRPSHKLVWSIAAYFGMDALISLVGGPFVRALASTGIFDKISVVTESATQATHLALWISALVCACSAAFYYAITTWFLKNRLNLE